MQASAVPMASAAVSAPGGVQAAVRSDAAVKVRERTCVGCRERAAPSEMIRLRYSPGALGPQVSLDLGQRSAAGRGGWVHPQSRCIAAACRGGFQRSFRAGVLLSADELTAKLHTWAHWRAERLLLGTESAQLVFGIEASATAVHEGRAKLVIIAGDTAVADRAPLQAALAAGCVRIWGSQVFFARVLGKPAMGALAVLDERLAQALLGALDKAQVPFAAPNISAPTICGPIKFSGVSRSMEDR